MTPAMVAAMTNRQLPKTGFFEIGLPSGIRRLMLGSGEAIWGGNTFKGRDPTIGHIDTTGDISETNDGIAPNTSFTIIPDPAADRSQLAAPTIQLSSIKIWLAALTLDGSNHVVAVADPEPMFVGFIDQAIMNGDGKQDDIDYTVISAFDYFFEDSEGQRLNGAYHQMLWPGEKGLDNVTGVTKHMYWGALAPTGVGTTPSSSITGGPALAVGGGGTGGAGRYSYSEPGGVYQ